MTKGSLRPDYRLSPLDSNYHSAEIIVDGKHYLGVAAAGADLSRPFYFKVAGIHNGTISVKSEACGLDEKKAYTNFAEVEFVLESKATRCLIEIFVHPQFDKDEADFTVWRGVSGVLLVRRSKALYLEAEQIRFGKPVVLKFKVEEPTKVRLNGCGTTYRGTHWTDAHIELDPSISSEESLCVIDGTLESISRKRDVALLFSTYGFDFIKIAEPEVKIDGARVRVTAEGFVSLLHFDGDTRFSHQASFKLGSGILRQYTSSGRFGFCEIGQEGIKCSH